MYFNRDRWEEYKKIRSISWFMIYEPALLSQFYYITHTEEEIRLEEERIKKLCELIKNYSALGNVM